MNWFDHLAALCEFVIARQISTVMPVGHLKLVNTEKERIKEWHWAYQ